MNDLGTQKGPARAVRDPIQMQHPKAHVPHRFIVECRGPTRADVSHARRHIPAIMH